MLFVQPVNHAEGLQLPKAYQGLCQMPLEVGCLRAAPNASQPPSPPNPPPPPPPHPPFLTLLQFAAGPDPVLIIS